MVRELLTLRVSRAEPELIVEGRGPLDLTAAPALDALSAMVASPGAPDLTLDLRTVAFCDVAGLRALEELQVRSASAQQCVRIRPSRAIKRAARLAGLTHVLGPDPRTSGR